MRKIIEALDSELIYSFLNGENLLVIRNIFQCYKNQGIQAAEVGCLLEEIRIINKDEDFEDRVLEAMDIVSGFCSPHMRVW